ncbi:unnamed protein product [Arabis nemorensis]|uniref:Uncharacterized protein n=1 Tax=Arabis nemorensis TaxID=586526 RepID=A0A565CQ20_9BRAS|nr:unnamed protein product [Arabis nemorensis]
MLDIAGMIEPAQLWSRPSITITPAGIQLITVGRREHRRKEGRVEVVEAPAKMPVHQNLFGENASPAKPDSSRPGIQLKSTQNWFRKEPLSTGEEKRLGKRPVGGEVGEPSADAPAMQQAHEKRGVLQIDRIQRKNLWQRRRRVSPEPGGVRRRLQRLGQ